MPRSIPTNWMTWNLPSLAYQTIMLRQEKTVTALTYQIILIFVDGLQNQRMRTENYRTAHASSIHPLWSKLLLCIPTVWSKLLFWKIFYLQDSKQPQRNRRIWTTNIKHFKITCQFDLNTRPGTMENAGKFNFKLNQQGLNKTLIANLFETASILQRSMNSQLCGTTVS